MCDFIGLRVFAHDPADPQRNDAEVVCSERVPHEAAGFRHFVQMLAQLSFGGCVLAAIQPRQGLGLGCISVWPRGSYRRVLLGMGSLAQEQSEQMRQLHDVEHPSVRTLTAK